MDCRTVRQSIHFFVNFNIFKWLYLAYYWVYLHQTWGFCKCRCALSDYVDQQLPIPQFTDSYLVPQRMKSGNANHSRPQSPRSFWPAAGIESSDRTRFSEHVQSICLIFSANQIYQIWQEVLESRTSGVGQSQSSRSLPQVRRIVALGTRMYANPVIK